MRIPGWLFVGVVGASCAPTTPLSRPEPPAGPDAACAKNGCLRTVTHVGDYARGAIQPTLEAGVTIDNGYSIDTISFFTDGAEARATVAVPYGVQLPLHGWDIVANAHGTTGLGDTCAVAGTIAGAGLAGTFGARGMIGVAVDYPGLAYLVADSEGHAVLDAMRAVRQLARWRGLRITGRYAAVGMSQGGHAVLAAAARHRRYAPELDVRGFAVVAPASVFEEHWRAGIAVDSPLVAVHAMLVYAWAARYRIGGEPLWAPAVLPEIDEIMQTHCMLSATGAPSLAERLGDRADALFSEGFLAAYRSGTWGPFAAFHDAFTANRIGPYDQTAPLAIYQGDHDDVVPEWATRQLVDALRAGGDTVEYEVVPGGTHTDVAFGFVAYPELRTDASLAWLRARLAP